MFQRPPTTYTCTECGWSRTSLSGSDVLMPGVNVWLSCPRCQGTRISARPATTLEIQIARMRRLLKLEPPLG